MTSSEIVDSAFEHRVQFYGHWVDKWLIPNPFIALLFSALEGVDISLEDFAFRQDTKSVADTALIVTVPKIRTTIILSVDKIIFRISNPDWDMAPQVVEVFDKVLDSVSSLVTVPIKTQETTLVFHVSPGKLDFSEKTSKLVDSTRLGPAKFYGVNLLGHDNALLIEASTKIEGGAFYRLSRTFRPSARFADIALAMHADEIRALSLLGVEGVI